MNAKGRLSLLLSEGFFASQVPPCFTSVGFAAKSEALGREWDEINSAKCLEEAAYERYSVARAGHARRPIAIVNPVPQFYLSRLIAGEWSAINKILKKSRLSLSIPSIDRTGGRSIKITGVKDVHEQRLLRSSGMRYALDSDITQFFPSIYTHSIAWAMEGKERAKSRVVRNDKSLLCNRLDELTRYTQQNQTMGIPIGPDTSHIISEIVGSAIDADLRAKLGSWPNGLRYVDDFSLYFTTESEASKAFSVLAETLQKYELKLNIQKTRIGRMVEFSTETWVHHFDTFDFSQKKEIQRSDLHRFFGLAFSLAKKFDDENVIQYALRRVETEIVKSQNWEVLAAYLMRCMDAYPNTIPECATIVDTYNRVLRRKDFDLRPWKAFISMQIAENAPFSRHSEIAWLLWLALRLGVVIDSKATSALELTTSSICLCLALHLESNNQLAKQLARKRLPQVKGDRVLFSEHWLLAYQAAFNNWLPGARDEVQKDRYFKHMLEKGVSFFDPTIAAPMLFSLRHERGDDNEHVRELLDSDDDVHEHFEFIDTRVDYLGRRRKAEEDEIDELIQYLQSKDD